MEYRQLEAYIKVVELGSFSQAAMELHISQPSISTYIASLEKELGAVLINRSTKVLSTTLAGERFLAKAKEMVALRRESIDMVKGLDKELTGEIRVLASSVPALYMVPGLLAGFRRLYPGISFEVAQADSSEVVQEIAAHKADIGFAGSLIENKNCSFFELADDELIFIAPHDDSFSSNKEYTLDDILYSGSFITREFGSGTRIQYEKYFVESGVTFDRIKTSARMGSTQGVINAVMSGLGVSIVSELAAFPMINQGLILPLKLHRRLPVRTIYSVLNRNIAHSHLVTLFLDYITKQTEQQKKGTA